MSAKVQDLRRRRLHLHSLVRFAFLVLRPLAPGIVGAVPAAGSCESDAREEHHHGDEENDEFHVDLRYGVRCSVGKVANVRRVGLTRCNMVKSRTIVSCWL